MSKVVHVENGPIGKTLLAFAMPVLVSQVLQEMYNITDCAVVGHFAGEAALASTGTAGLILTIFINFFIGFSSGISVITGRLFGEYDYDKLRKTMSSVVRLTFIAGITLTVLVFLLADPYLALLNCPDSVKPLARTYIHICAMGMTAQLLYNVGTAILRSLGDTRAPLICYFISCTINLVLDVVLVVVFRMGIAGAAYATLISQLILAGLLFIRLLHLEEDCALRLNNPGLTAAEIKDVFKIGIPSGMQALFMSISSMILQVSINSFGPAAMAGMTCYIKLESILYLPCFAYGVALTGFVGQNYGAGRSDRIKEAVRISNRIMWIIIFPLSIFIAFASPILLRVFTNDPDIIFNANQALVYNSPVYIVYAINQVYLGAIKGMGKTFYPMICTLVTYSIFRVAWCNILLPIIHSMVIVYLSYDVSFFLMLFMLLPVYRRMLNAAADKIPATAYIRKTA